MSGWYKGEQIVNFLKKLLGGAGPGEKNILSLYVRPKRCDKIVRVRINLYNDLSLSDGDGYHCRKTARAARCPFAAEIFLRFDKNRRLLEQEIENGEFVSEENYLEWAAQQDM